jgi:ribonuclease D
LGPLCESLLEISLAKEHSAVDWSIRPLRSEWLDYAALDVALLVDLRDAVAANLEAQGKGDWARAEFAAALAAPKPAPRVDPWRRTSGMHQIKSRYELALIRELWLARDRRAQEIDLAPGRLLSDAVIVELAIKKPIDESSFRTLPIMKERIRNQVQREHLPMWWQVLSQAYAISEAEWPQMRAKGEALPPARIWRNKFPLAAIHLAHVRAGLAEVSTAKNIPVENIISPELVRRVVFDEGRERSFANQPSLEEEIRNRLKEFGARDWQIELAAPALASGLANDQPPPEPPTPPAE